MKLNISNGKKKREVTIGNGRLLREADQANFNERLELNKEAIKSAVTSFKPQAILQIASKQLDFEVSVELYTLCAFICAPVLISFTCEPTRSCFGLRSCKKFSSVLA